MAEAKHILTYRCCLRKSAGASGSVHAGYGWGAWDNELFRVANFQWLKTERVALRRIIGPQSNIFERWGAARRRVRDRDRAM
jgi:hypothetical protein